jgi:hypothetical protein
MHHYYFFLEIHHSNKNMRLCHSPSFFTPLTRVTKSLHFKESAVAKKVTALGDRLTAPTDTRKIPYLTPSAKKIPRHSPLPTI